MFKEKKKLIVVLVAVPQLGHFIPITHCATALIEAGHEAHIITCGNSYIKALAKKFAEPHGIRMHFTNCGLTKEDLLRKPISWREDPSYTFQNKWQPYVYEVMKAINPDVALNDFTSYAGTFAAD
jgi:UDP:flavonoid glycosyltransferase YjiC (YdhE family)